MRCALWVQLVDAVCLLPPRPVQSPCCLSFVSEHAVLVLGHKHSKSVWLTQPAWQDVFLAAIIVLQSPSLHFYLSCSFQLGKQGNRRNSMEHLPCCFCGAPGQRVWQLGKDDNYFWSAEPEHCGLLMLFHGSCAFQVPSRYQICSLVLLWDD